MTASIFFMYTKPGVPGPPTMFTLPVSPLRCQPHEQRPRVACGVPSSNDVAHGLTERITDSKERDHFDQTGQETIGLTRAIRRRGALPLVCAVGTDAIRPVFVQ